MLTKTIFYKGKILYYSMVFKKEEGYNISELGNWNVASDYARLKIMRPLDACDHYENIARFGYDTLIEQLDNFGIPLDTLKLIGFERLVNELIKLCSNSMFAMRTEGTKKELKDIKEKLEKIRGVIPTLSKTITKKKNKILILENKNFYKLLDMVLDIKAKINEPLNKNHLIFTDKQEFDPKAYKKSISDDAKTRG